MPSASSVTPTQARNRYLLERARDVRAPGWRGCSVAEGGTLSGEVK